MSQTVFVFDSMFKVADEIRNHLVASGIAAQAFSDMNAFAEALEIRQPDVLLVNAESLQNDAWDRSLFEHVPAIAYAPEMAPDEQLQLYEMGLRRVVVAFPELPQRVVYALKFYLNCRYNIRQKRRASITHGDMETLSLAELLQNAMLERKNLIVKIHHPRWDARIRTYLGHVVEVNSSNLEGEDAILKTLQFGSGVFNIRSYEKQYELPRMNISTPALLAEMQFQQQAYENLLRELQAKSTNPLLKVVQSAELLNLNKAQLDLLDMVETEGNLKNILRNSPFSFLQTINMLHGFHQQKIISVRGVSVGTAKEMFDRQQPPVEAARPTAANNTHARSATPAAPESVSNQNALPDAIATPPKAPSTPAAAAPDARMAAKSSLGGTLVVFGNAGRSEFVATLAKGFNTSMKSNGTIDFTRVPAVGGQSLTALGVSVNEAFLPALEKVARQVTGVVMLLDAQKPGEWEYARYLLTRILQLYPVPCVVALTNLKTDSHAALDMLRKTFTLPPRSTFQTLAGNAQKDVRAVLDFIAAQQDVDEEADIAEKSLPEEDKHV